MIKEIISGQEIWLPDDPEVLRHSRICVTNVLEGEYSYPRETSEDVRIIIDIGCNVGAFILWATKWWPKARLIHAYEPHQAALKVAMFNASSLGMVDFNRAAVTINTAPRLACEVAYPSNWGGMNTVSEIGEPVPAVHPKDLPPCDALKVDCEGCELEVFEHYPHLDRCKVVMFEYHRLEFREPMMWRMTDLGFRMRRGNPNSTTAPDTQVWTR